MWISPAHNPLFAPQQLKKDNHRIDDLTRSCSVTLGTALSDNIMRQIPWEQHLHYIYFYRRRSEWSEKFLILSKERCSRRPTNNTSYIKLSRVKFRCNAYVLKKSKNIGQVGDIDDKHILPGAENES